jgi:hypothetical protein
LPQQYAGGGIIAFNGGGSAFGEDVNKFKDWYTNKLKESASAILTPIQDLKNYFTQPRAAQTPVDIEDAAAGSAMTAMGQAKPDNKIVIHPNAPRAGVPTTNLSQITGGPATRDYGSAGIDALRTRYEDMIKGSEDFGQAQKDAERNAFRKTMLGLMATKNPYALGAAGEVGLAGQESLEKSMEAIQGRKDKQIGQLVALGLKGEDLKNELKKLGVTEEYYRAHYPLLAAQAKYYGAKGSGLGAGITAGPIGAKDYFALKDKYNAIALNPKSDPSFYNSLPEDVKNALNTKVGSPSYQRGLEVVKQLTVKMMAQDISEARAVGAKKVPLSSIEE